MLILDSVSRSFGAGIHRRCVLDQVSVSIAAGSETVIIGRSGSGKSTLLNLISGIDRPDAGRVIFDGQDLSALREPQRTLFRRRRVGFVYQFFNLLPTLSVEENVRLVLSLDGVGKLEARRRSQAMLARVGLGDRLEAPVDVLSGGEQQRVALARALVHEPALVLADEPTGNLDEVTAAQLGPLLRELARERGATVILVTHDRQLAAGADRCLTLREGQLRSTP
ncbi:MAG TPA: ABC transporter ATP-binding protein [Steroidobacteraceae bacterium]|nr:ABC transporter ATP-binding protein [Steroidobacteraceae bacterium]